MADWAVLYASRMEEDLVEAGRAVRRMEGGVGSGDGPLRPRESILGSAVGLLEGVHPLIAACQAEMTSEVRLFGHT